MHPEDYQIIAGFGIIIDFVALILFAVYPLSPADGTTVVAFYIIGLLGFFAFTGLLHGAARILKIENRSLLFSAFIAFTSLIIFFVVLRLDLLGPYLNPFELDSSALYEKYTDPSEYIEIYQKINNPLPYYETYRKASIAFASIIMWITTVGMAKFMYRTKWFKAFLVSLPLFVVTCCLLMFL